MGYDAVKSFYKEKKSFWDKMMITILALLLIVTSFNGMQLVKVSANEGTIINENFNEVETDRFPEGWIDKNGLASEHKIPNAAVEFPSADNKSLRVAKPAEKGTNRVVKEFDPITKNITVSFDIQLAKQYAFFQFNMYDGKNRPVRMVMRPEGAAPQKKIMVFDGSFKKSTVMPYVPDQWYSMKFVIDPDKRVYDFFLNGDLIANSHSFFGSSFASFTSLDFHTSSSNASAEAYIDNLKVVTGGEIIGEHFGSDLGEVILGEPLAGGEGYSKMIEPADAQYMVSNKDELLNALSQASAGDIVYVHDESEINLTSLGTSSLLIPGGVTLASGRGRNGSLGGLIYTDFMKDMEPDMQPGYESRNKALWIDGLLKTNGPNVRITGLRIQGNDMNTSLDIPNFRTYMLPVSTGIYSNDWIEVDNNEIYGWSFAGVRTGNGHIHHNHIHHTWRTGLGYNITMDFMPNDGKGVNIEGNFLDKFRHAIAGMGLASDSYTASYNHVGTGISFAFDMHTNKEGDSAHGANGGTYIAGNHINIHHNTFTDMNNRAVTIRGIPVEGVFMDFNWFHRPFKEAYEVIQQRNSYGNFFVGKNAYGLNQDIHQGHVPPLTSSMNLNSVKLSTLLGNTIDELKPNQYVQVDASVRNNHYYPGNATLISVIKAETGIIQSMTHTSSIIAPRESSSLQTALTLPERVEGLSVENMVWNSIHEMRPANSYESSETLIAKTEVVGSTLSISGSTTAGEGRLITLLVLNPDENPIFIDEISAGSGGEYSVEYELLQQMSGTYTVKIGGDGIEVPELLNAEYKISLLTISTLIDFYIQIGELLTPLSDQLQNELSQAQQHYDAGRINQTAQSLENALHHLNNDAMSGKISSTAKAVLIAAINAFVAEM